VKIFGEGIRQVGIKQNVVGFADTWNVQSLILKIMQVLHFRMEMDFSALKKYKSEVVLLDDP
jgi:hypothetical protein